MPEAQIRHIRISKIAVAWSQQYNTTYTLGLLPGTPRQLNLCGGGLIRVIYDERCAA